METIKQAVAHAIYLVTTRRVVMPPGRSASRDLNFREQTTNGWEKPVNGCQVTAGY